MQEKSKLATEGGLFGAMAKEGVTPKDLFGAKTGADADIKPKQMIVNVSLTDTTGVQKPSLFEGAAGAKPIGAGTSLFGAPKKPAQDGENDQDNKLNPADASKKLFGAPAASGNGLFKPLASNTDAKKPEKEIADDGPPTMTK